MTARLVGFPKKVSYRSEKLRRAVAALPCVCCGREGMTQAAHANQGKGMGIKAPDSWLAALCAECHAALDQGGILPKEERRAFEMEMIAKTYVALIEAGLLQVTG